MALQRVAAQAQQGQQGQQGQAPQNTAVTAVSAGPALSTRETTNRPFLELGVMFGQALGGREPVMQALTNLQNIGQEHGCDAIIAVRLLHYPTAAGPAVVAYGTGVRFLPQPANDSTTPTGTSNNSDQGTTAPRDQSPSTDTRGTPPPAAR